MLQLCENRRTISLFLQVKNNLSRSRESNPWQCRPFKMQPQWEVLNGGKTKDVIYVYPCPSYKSVLFHIKIKKWQANVARATKVTVTYTPSSGPLLVFWELQFPNLTLKIKTCNLKRDAAPGPSRNDNMEWHQVQANQSYRHRGKEICPTYPPAIALLTLDSNNFGLSLNTAAASWLRGSSWFGCYTNKMERMDDIRGWQSYSDLLTEELINTVKRWYNP